ncbi:unnamed protein product [Brassica oleracea var. botrytis]
MCSPSGERPRACCGRRGSFFPSCFFFLLSIASSSPLPICAFF